MQIIVWGKEKKKNEKNFAVIYFSSEFFLWKILKSVFVISTLRCNSLVN